MNSKFGFSTGCLHKIEPDIRKALAIYRELGYKAIELNMMRQEEFSDNIGRITAEDLKGFDYVSLHAPKMRYGNNAVSWNVLNLIHRFNKKVRELDIAVFHPDTVDSFYIFHGTGFRVAFENLDNRTKSFNTSDEMYELLLSDSNWNMVFDLNHIFTVDGNMFGIYEFHTKLRSKIKQVHLSGYREDFIHAPLFKTRLDDIIRATNHFNVPIIVESVLESADEVEQEKKYIEEILNGP